MSGQAKGKSFEDEVGEVLKDLERRFPKHVVAIYHPQMMLENGEEVIPDWHLKVVLPGVSFQMLIECQNRKTNSTEIARKITHIKAKSDRNVFCFVYPDQVSGPARKSLEADGVECKSLPELRIAVDALAKTLDDVSQGDIRRAASTSTTVVNSVPKRSNTTGAGFIIKTYLGGTGPGHRRK